MFPFIQQVLMEHGGSAKQVFLVLVVQSERKRWKSALVGFPFFGERGIINK